MKPIIFIITLFLLTSSASAQNQRSSASQVISIKIQKVTLVKFQHASSINVDSTFTMNKESKKESNQIQQKELLLTVSEDETYVKRNEELEDIEDPVTVTTQTSL